MMPSCSHTGTPRHFHSSTTSGTACLMMLRMRASVSPRQSPSSLILDAIEGRAPLHGLPYTGDRAHDERVEVAPDVAFPARHGRDIGLYRSVAVPLSDLRIAA